METRAADSAQFPRLHEAIGGVMFSSSAFSDALQQLAATVIGSDLIFFLLEDKMMGGQLKDVQQLLEGTNSNEWVRHPSISESDRADAIALLKLCEYFVQRRNRVAHDQFAVYPSDEVADQVEARRATRWPKKHLTTSITSLRLLDHSLFSAAISMQILDQAILGTRAGKPPLRDLRERVEFDRHIQGMRRIQQNQDKRWLWHEEASPFR